LSRSGARVEATPTAPTTFVVTGTNQAGCTDTAQIRIGMRSASPIQAFASPDHICPGEEVRLEARGGRRYQWYFENGRRMSRSEMVEARPRDSQTFKVIGVDDAGCESEAEVSVQVSDGKRPVADFSVEKTLTCAGQEVSFTDKSLGAVAYRWEFPTGIPGTSTEANPKVRFTTEGIHDVVLTVTGCGGETNRKEEIGLIVTTPPVRISLNASDQTLCQGSPFRLVARGASSYTWESAPGLSATTGKSVTVRPAALTTYKVTGTDADGCQGQAQVTFSVVGSGKRTKVSPFAPVICEGESVTLRAEGALSYSWTPQRNLDQYNSGVVIASPKTTTAYVVESTDIDGCTFRDTVVVKVQPKANLEIVADKTQLCQGDRTNLSIAQTGVFNWSPAEGLSGTTGTRLEAFPSQTTTYTVRGTDQHGCKMRGEIKIQVGRPTKFTVAAQDEEICPGEATLLTATGANTYRWYPATGLERDNGALVKAAPEKTTTYTVVAGEGGCGNQQTVTVVVKPKRPLRIEPATPRICAGSTLTLTALGGKAYIWDAAEGLNTVAGSKVQVTPTQTTSYQVFALNEQGCESQGAVTVVVDDASFLRLSASEGKICAGNPVELNVTGAESYEWLEGLPAGAHARSLTRPEERTTYRVAGVNAAGCRDTASISLEVGRLKGDFDMTAMRLDLAKESGLVHFRDLTENAQEWLWRFGKEGNSRDASPSYVFTEPGTYPVTLLVSDGVCVDTVRREVIVQNSSSLQDIADGGKIQIKRTETPGGVILDLNSPREMYLQMRVMSQEGAEVMASNIRLPAGSYQQQLDLTSFPKGTYDVQLSDGQEMLSEKVSVE
ncbi:MAG: PKD domain-containing protein, partial [Bacteroidota bacterium]